MKKREKEEKLEKLRQKDMLLESMKKDKEENNRLRSVIHVQNKLRMSEGNGGMKTLKSHPTSNTSYLIGASKRVYESPLRLKQHSNLKTIDNRL